MKKALIAILLPVIASAADSTAPVINPAQSCMSEGMNNPPGKTYGFLYNKDCSVVHVLPSRIENPKVQVWPSANLQLCDGLKAHIQSFNDLNKRINKLQLQTEVLEEKLTENLKESEFERISKQVQSLDKKRRELEFDAMAMRKETAQFGKIPGATISVFLNNSITQEELNYLRALNHSNLVQKIKRVDRSLDENGNEVISEREEYKISSLRPAQISSSLYSFSFYSLDQENPTNSIISTTLPGFEVLEQMESHQSVAHVRAGDVVTGEVVMSLLGVCDSVVEDENGRPSIDLSGQSSPLTVNRTYGVNQVFTQGYEAKLDVDSIADQIISHVTHHKNSGFTKSSEFSNTIDTMVDSLIDFKWDSDSDNSQILSIDKVLEIKKEVSAHLIDNYFSKLVEQGILKIENPTSLPPAQGGMVPETQLAHRCWTEKRGGFSGLIGKRRQVCADYTYTVNVWKDGFTTEELKNHLTMNHQYIDRMTVNRATPFYYTTTFIRDGAKQ